jgi:hypothetical protein
VNGRLTVKYAALMTPVILADEAIEKANKKEKLWEKEAVLKESIRRAHLHLTRINTKTTAGLAAANRMADAIEIMASELKDSDYVLRVMKNATHLSFHPRKKSNGKTAFYPPEEVNGRRVWTPIIDVDARYAPREQAAVGSRWETVIGRFATYQKLVTYPIVVAAGRPNVGEAELGVEDDFRPYPEPQPNGRLTIRRSDGENAEEDVDDGDLAFNVVDEERANRRYTYNPEAEEERLQDILERVEDCETEDDFVLLHDEVEIAWKAKAFRWHIYQQAMNAVILAAKEAVDSPTPVEHKALEVIEDLKGKRCEEWLNLRRIIVQKDSIQNWVLVGSSDANAPNHLNDLRFKLERLKAERIHKIRPQLTNPDGTRNRKAEVQLRKNLSQAKALRSTLARFERKSHRSMQWAWNNFLTREGLGEGFNGQRFDDNSEDALERKEVRAGDMETMEGMEDDNNSVVSELLELTGIGEGTIRALEEAGYSTVDEINDATFEELYQVIRNKYRTYLVWWGGANLVVEKPKHLSDLRYVASSLFGKTRGLSVDLLRPFHRPEENIRAEMERDLSDSAYITKEDAEEALEIQSWLRPEHWDHLPRSEFRGIREFTPDEDVVSRCIFLR